MYYPPYLPHELDLHPDGKRILATLEEQREDLQREIDDAYERGQDESKAEVADLERENEKLKDDIYDLEGAVSDLEAQLEKTAA